MILAESVAGFVKRDGFNIIMVAICPFESIVVIYFAPGYIQLVVVICVDRIASVICENNSKGDPQNEGASVGRNLIKKSSRQPSGMYHIRYVIEASSKSL